MVRWFVSADGIGAPARHGPGRVVRHRARPFVSALLSVSLLAAHAGAGLCDVAQGGKRAPGGADDFGILNPDDAGRAMLIRRIEMGMVDSVTCSLGINSTKYDDHATARMIATKCAEAGIVKGMTWMSMFESNGIGAPSNPAAAAEWDRRAAEAGDPVGTYNYGLDLLRGDGVPRDEVEGRRHVDAAADLGVGVAVRLRDSGYDLDEVTPVADRWKYAPPS